MAKTRREFTFEFKREAVSLWETSGRPQTEVAAELGLQPSQLRRWQKLVQGTGPRSAGPASGPALSLASANTPLPADLAAENTRLRRELDRARAERDILKNHRGAEFRLRDRNRGRYDGRGGERP
jgi:transposase